MLPEQGRGSKMKPSILYHQNKNRSVKTDGSEERAVRGSNGLAAGVKAHTAKLEALRSRHRTEATPSTCPLTFVSCVFIHISIA